MDVSEQHPMSDQFSYSVFFLSSVSAERYDPEADDEEEVKVSRSYSHLWPLSLGQHK